MWEGGGTGVVEEVAAVGLGLKSAAGGGAGAEILRFSGDVVEGSGGVEKSIEDVTAGRVGRCGIAFELNSGTGGGELNPGSGGGAREGDDWFDPGFGASGIGVRAATTSSGSSHCVIPF